MRVIATVPDVNAERLRVLAVNTDRSISWHVAQAVALYLGMHITEQKESK